MGSLDFSIEANKVPFFQNRIITLCLFSYVHSILSSRWSQANGLLPSSDNFTNWIRSGSFVVTFLGKNFAIAGVVFSAATSGRANPICIPRLGAWKRPLYPGVHDAD
jgi:hypothetical protein